MVEPRNHPIETHHANAILHLSGDSRVIPDQPQAQQEGDVTAEISPDAGVSAQSRVSAPRVQSSSKPTTKQPSSDSRQTTAPPLTHLAKELLPHRSRKKYPYPAFRPTCFSDKALLPLDYSPPTPLKFESQRAWTTTGPHIGCEPRLEWKRSALYTPSVDRVYDTTRETLSYRVHMSMWGSSLWDTTERFASPPSQTSVRVGPGAYDTAPMQWGKQSRPPPIFPPSSLKPRSNQSALHHQITPTLDAKHMNKDEPPSLDNWKHTSKRALASRPAFDKAARTTWVDIESTKAQRMRKRAVSTPVLENLPSFVSGTRTGALRSPPKTKL
ncbi:hypothetical protein LEN26_002781 [Aphanomyces euteiches]|nr:hypothetical protein AeMF1_021040 [Aphanomyces euteiches]KAH9158694.1 hypothetical protein LEN26_002781 [Aphanomyces euteiches]KAH9195684.1 hypothetical protein AeNC1_002321 [Aphanomyces euteiches]